MSYKKILKLSDLWVGEMKGVIVDGLKILLIHMENGVFAFEDRCLHQGVPLSTGKLEGTSLTCSAHEWQYDACTGRGLNPKDIQLKTYPVKIEGTDIWVDTLPDKLTDTTDGDRHD